MSEICIAGGSFDGASPFDKTRQTDNRGEYWSARDLMLGLSYTEWRNFEQVVLLAKTVIEANGHLVSDHVVDATKMIEAGKGASRKIPDYRLSRFACYMIALSADIRKPAVAAARQYFAVRARQAEVAEEQRVATGLTTGEFSTRIRRSLHNHIKYIDHRFSPGDYTVVSSLYAHFQMMDEELILHGIMMEAHDRPDGSIGSLWSRHARRLGIIPFEKKAPLLMPGLTVSVNVWPASSHTEFRRWFKEDYGLGKLRDYMLNKKEFFEIHGKLAIESAVYNVSMSWTGVPHPGIPEETLKMIRDNNGIIRSQKSLEQ